MKITDDDEDYILILENDDDILLTANVFYKYVIGVERYHTFQEYVVHIKQGIQYNVSKNYEKDIQYMLRIQKLKRILNE